MDKFNVGALMALFLMVGLLAGGLYGYNSVEDKVVEVEVEKVVEVPGETVYVNQTVEVEVPADFSSIFIQARNDFIDELDDEDEFECGGETYRDSEVSIDRDYNKEDYSITFTDDNQGDEYTVEFELRLEYDEEDEDSCEVEYSVSVEYEEDEDTEFDYTIL